MTISQREGTCNDACGTHACDLPPGHDGLHVCVGRYEDEYSDRDDWWTGNAFTGPAPPAGWSAPHDCCAMWDETGRRVRH